MLNSELGVELMKLKNLEYGSYDPTPVKNIMVLAEDTRIALRKSELVNLGLQNNEVEQRLENIYLNLRNGQQCVGLLLVHKRKFRKLVGCLSTILSKYSEFN